MQRKVRAVCPILVVGAVCCFSFLAQARVIDRGRVRPWFIVGAAKGHKEGFHWGSKHHIANHLGRPKQLISMYTVSSLTTGPTYVGHDPRRCHYTLRDLVQAHPQLVLGEKAYAKYGPMYGKTIPAHAIDLAARRALSGQSHPSADQAGHGHGHAKIGHLFCDGLEKAEFVRAMTPFSVMHGFRKPHQIKEHLQQVASRYVTFRYKEGHRWVRTLETKGVEQVVMDLLDSRRPDQAVQREQLVKAVLNYADRLQSHDPLTAQFIKKLKRQNDEDVSATLRDQNIIAFDPGIVLPLMLNSFELQPGEGLFQSPGLPHAYMGEVRPNDSDQGYGYEVVQGGDNIFRLGMTPKTIVDLKLLKEYGIRAFNVTPVDVPTAIIKPQRSAHDPTLISYATPDSDVFEYSEINITREHPIHRQGADRSVHLFAVRAGKVGVTFPNRGKERFNLKAGDRFWAPANAGAYDISIADEGDSLVQRVAIGVADMFDN